MKRVINEVSMKKYSVKIEKVYRFKGEKVVEGKH